jgi:hypothetical protein
MLTRAAGIVIAGTSPIPTEIKQDQNRTWQHREPLKGAVIFWMKPKKTACHWDIELWTFTFRLANIVSTWIDWANTPTCTASVARTLSLLLRFDPACNVFGWSGG